MADVGVMMVVAVLVCVALYAALIGLATSPEDDESGIESGHLPGADDEIEWE